VTLAAVTCNRAFRLVILGLLTMTPVFAYSQQHPSTKVANAPGVVSGRVFAITGAGDIKPARVATVYLLYVYRSVKYAEAHPEDENSAGMEWLKQRNTAFENFMDERKTNGESWSDSLDCQTELLTYRKALLGTLNWATSKNKPWQIIGTETDEEGMFRVEVPRPGKYTLIVRGRAGFNEAAWISENIHVAPGTETKMIR
jgi:hypothetical protein